MKVNKFVDVAIFIFIVLWMIAISYISIIGLTISIVIIVAYLLTKFLT